MRSIPLISLLSASILFSGCSSFTGIGGDGDYGCKAQPGVSCMSVSGVYENAVQRNLPSQREADGAAAKNQAYDKADVAGNTPYSGMPLRSQTRVLRVWVAPWEDSEGDLNDQSYSYVVVDSGRWMIDHNRRNIANEYAPIRPPIGGGAAKGDADAKKPAGGASE